MPLIVAKRDRQRWLEPGDPQRRPVDLLRPFESDQMKAWRADERINNVKNTGPELGKPMKDDGDEQPGIFDVPK